MRTMLKRVSSAGLRWGSCNPWVTNPEGEAKGPLALELGTMGYRSDLHSLAICSWGSDLSSLSLSFFL
jgi:hypothetical protein